jgi:hypothetical protein
MVYIMDIEKIKGIQLNLTKLLSAYSDNDKYKTILENMITTCDMKISLLEINKLDCSKKKNILGDISNLYFITDDNKENLKRFDEDKYQQIIKFIHNEKLIRNTLWESGLESISGCSSDDQSNNLPNFGNEADAADAAFQKAATDATAYNDLAAAESRAAIEAIFNKVGGGKRRKKKMRSKRKSKTHKKSKTKSKTKSKRRSKRRSKKKSKKR